MKPTETCSKCGQGAYHNQGISKTKFSPEYPNGISYENIKCGNPACKFIQWIDIKGSPKPQNSHQGSLPWSPLPDTSLVLAQVRHRYRHHLQ